MTITKRIRNHHKAGTLTEQKINQIVSEVSRGRTGQNSQKNMRVIVNELVRRVRESDGAPIFEITPEEKEALFNK